ncbi:uncharacterized protein EDB91DRAFT_643847 [Suillus paluster]|uniref:uncharacterized protein n=1 Tax=Suillus paluster TaxID=48578 RepID=UPI001B87FC6E|nr:uncharacterized protein EDB91DRAFT_643847 [Suillus paluster]KAG1733384.1 hypothetical protein EDB91DRAFT_643847 [Suillus paluster]
MVLDPPYNSIVEQPPADFTTTIQFLSFSTHSPGGAAPSITGPLSPLTFQSLNPLSSPTNEVLEGSTSPQVLTASGAMTSQSITTPSTTTSTASTLLSSSTSFSLSSSSITNSESTVTGTESSSSTPSWSSLTANSDSYSPGSSSIISTHPPSSSSSTPTMTTIVSSTSTSSPFASSSTTSTIPLSSTSLSSSLPTTTASTFAVVSTSAPTFTFTSSSSSHVTPTFNYPSVSTSESAINPTSTTLITSTSTTEVDGYVPTPVSTSTLILTSVLSGHGTTTWTTTTSGVLSTAVVDTTGNGFSRSPGSIIGLTLGVLGAIAFAALWLFCARRRQRKLSRDANAIPPWAPGGPLDAEVDMEERYAGILAALNAGMGAGRNARIEGDTSGEVSGELAIARASSPTLPLYSHPAEDNDGPYVFPLSPPPSAYAPPPPPSAYVPLALNSSRRRSSPGPDPSAWFGGYSVAPAPSAASHHSHSTSNFLTRTETGTRTRTGSEEPLLTRAGSGSSYLDYGNKVRLGSAFGSPEGSMNGHTLPPTSPSLGMRSATTSSFDALHSVSSQGQLRSTSSHGYEFGLGSTSSGTGSYQGPALGLAMSAAPISYKSRRVTKWKKGKRESTGSSTATSASVCGFGEEKPVGVRAFLGRLRRGNTPSPKADSSRELPRHSENEGEAEKMAFSTVVSPATPPPDSVPTSPRFVLSNPDPQHSSPYAHVPIGGREDGLQPPAWPWLTVQATTLPPFGLPSPAPTDESRVSTADGLLDPRLRDPVEGRSNASLRDFEDYSRPIGGLMTNRMHSTTTFGTIDTQDIDNGTYTPNREDDQQEDNCATATQTPRESWIIDGAADVFHAR